MGSLEDDEAPYRRVVIFKSQEPSGEIIPNWDKALNPIPAEIKEKQ